MPNIPTRVFEVRNETAIEQMQSSLATVAETVDTWLFAHVKDAGLTRLGVDEHVIGAWVSWDAAGVRFTISPPDSYVGLHDNP